VGLDQEKADAQRSMRSIIARNTHKIEAARQNGWSMSEIATSLGVGGADPAATLRSYLWSIKKSAERQQDKQSPLPRETI
jgi:3-methyladenine DNA glycosylase Tag